MTAVNLAMITNGGGNGIGINDTNATDKHNYITKYVTVFQQSCADIRYF